MRLPARRAKPYTQRLYWRFAWLPHLVGDHTWVWLECYGVTEKWSDPDGDGVFAWVPTGEVLQ